MEHTKWESHPDAPSLIRDVETGERLFTLSFSVGYKPPRSQRHEIARLVGAAPAMLAALERMADIAEVLNGRQHAGLEVTPPMWSEMYQRTNEARVAIAKARGTA